MTLGSVLPWTGTAHTTGKALDLVNFENGWQGTTSHSPQLKVKNHQKS